MIKKNLIIYGPKKYKRVRAFTGKRVEFKPNLGSKSSLIHKARNEPSSRFMNLNEPSSSLVELELGSARLHP